MPVTFTCVKIADVIAHARRNDDSEGYIDLDAFISGVKRLHFTERQYKTPLEYIDERDQNPSWPPTGRWPVKDRTSSKDDESTTADNIGETHAIHDTHDA